MSSDLYTFLTLLHVHAPDVKVVHAAVLEPTAQVVLLDGRFRL